LTKEERRPVAGSFHTVRGKTRDVVAAFDARTSALRPWRLRFGVSDEIHPARVTALAVSGSTVYLGGGFASANGSGKRLAAVDGITGRVRKWTPQPDGPISKIIVSGGSIYVAPLLLLSAAVSSLAAADEPNLSRMAQQSGWPNVIPDDGITALAASGRRLFLGGDFRRFGRPTSHFVVVDRSTGRINSGFPRVSGGSFVDAIVSDEHGGWFVGGRFTSVGGVPCPNLAHIRADRTLDAGWCTHPDSDVTSLALSGRTLYDLGDPLHPASLSRRSTSRSGTNPSRPGLVVQAWL
jgi:hypothetical protein